MPFLTSVRASRYLGIVITGSLSGISAVSPALLLVRRGIFSLSVLSVEAIGTAAFIVADEETALFFANKMEDFYCGEG